VVAKYSPELQQHRVTSRDELRFGLIENIDHLDVGQFHCLASHPIRPDPASATGLPASAIQTEIYRGRAFIALTWISATGGHQRIGN
jgi:hypothetical protein